MNILLVYPQSPSTFWSFRNAVKFISKKSAEPPLGLITVAAMLPATWDKKLIDMNIRPLKDEHILWADFVFLTGMTIHKESFKKVLRRCNALNRKVVAGGPMVSFDYKEFPEVDHFVLNEAEITLPRFLEDLEKGRARQIYSSKKFPDICRTPVPLWNLLEKDKYSSMSIQYSRGCPHNCEFCSITVLNGHKPRTKSSAQFLAELEALYMSGWRDGVFIVDDNFIGNKKKLKNDFLPALIEWSKAHDYPFEFTTEVSINLADDARLMSLMSLAGFNHTFVGIETTHSASLAECGKKQNIERDLLSSVRKLHQAGLRVSGGFILGFDHDPPSIFKDMTAFIQNSGVVTAMVGLLNAPSGTPLWQRLKKEKRLLNEMSGDNLDGSINFVPIMNYHNLIAGYKEVLTTIYSQKVYYERVKTFLKEYRPSALKSNRVCLQGIKALFKSIWILGFLEKGKRYYWKLFFYSLLRQTKKFPLAVEMAIYGFHFRQIIKSL